MRITGINDGVQAEGTDGLTISTLGKSTKSAILTEQRGGTAESDTVDISEEGRALAALAAAEGKAAAGGSAETAEGEQAGEADASGVDDGDGSGDSSDDGRGEGGVISLNASAREAQAAVSAYDGNETANSTYEKLLEEIQKLQEQIREVQNDSSLTEEQKRIRVQELQQQLLSLQSQLVKAKAMSAGDPLTFMGGTRAEGASFQMASHMLPTDSGGGDAK